MRRNGVCNWGEREGGERERERKEREGGRGEGGGGERAMVRKAAGKGWDFY